MGTGYSASSGASGGSAGTGAQRFGAIHFGSMAQGVDVRWLVGGAVAVALILLVFLMWG